MYRRQSTRGGQISMALQFSSFYHHIRPTNTLSTPTVATANHINTPLLHPFPCYISGNSNIYPFESGTKIAHPRAHKPVALDLHISKHNIRLRVHSSKPSEGNSSSMAQSVDCIGTGSDVECLMNSDESTLREGLKGDAENEMNVGESEGSELGLAESVWEWAILISPFFFWGTAMVAMKEVLPKVGPFFIAAFRLIPAGMLLIGFAKSKGRAMPSGMLAWVSISLFALVDASFFQGFLAEGLERTSAGLGSVIIDSQPLTVAVLAALLFGESIGYGGAAGLVLGIIGLLLLEVPAIEAEGSTFSLWGSGEWWMLLAAQSMAVGTVMVRWVSKYSDPVMATGWHMLIGGIPLLAISVLNHDPAFDGSIGELTGSDLAALLYTSIFGSAVSYGVFFYNATRGSLTKLSSLTFLTPMFASIFGYLYLGERFSSSQLLGAFVTIIAIYLVNNQSTSDSTK